MSSFGSLFWKETKRGSQWWFFFIRKRERSVLDITNEHGRASGHGTGLKGGLKLGCAKKASMYISTRTNTEVAERSTHRDRIGTRGGKSQSCVAYPGSTLCRPLATAAVGHAKLTC